MLCRSLRIGMLAFDVISAPVVAPPKLPRKSYVPKTATHGTPVTLSASVPEDFDPLTHIGSLHNVTPFARVQFIAEHQARVQVKVKHQLARVLLRRVRIRQVCERTESDATSPLLSSSVQHAACGGAGVQTRVMMMNLDKVVVPADMSAEEKAAWDLLSDPEPHDYTHVPVYLIPPRSLTSRLAHRTGKLAAAAMRAGVEAARAKIAALRPGSKGLVRLTSVGHGIHEAAQAIGGQFESHRARSMVSRASIVCERVSVARAWSRDTRGGCRGECRSAWRPRKRSSCAAPRYSSFRAIRRRRHARTSRTNARGRSHLLQAHVARRHAVDVARQRRGGAGDGARAHGVGAGQQALGERPIHGHPARVRALRLAAGEHQHLAVALRLCKRR
jgi:hypothetical protein